MNAKKACVHKDIEEAGPSNPKEDKPFTYSSPPHSCFHDKVHITNLPTEILAIAFRYCSYREVAEKLRLVCRRFCNVATLVLSSGLATLSKKIERAMKAVEFSMENVQDNHDLLVMSRAFNAMELLQFHHRMLRAVTWRYVCNPFIGSEPLACFYAGLLLDELVRIIRMAFTTPASLGFSFHNRDHRSSEINRFIRFSKKFMNHFEKITEKKLNIHYSISGAKLIDIMDCMVSNDHRDMPYEHVNTDLDKGECHIKAHYRMKRAWFTSLDTAERSNDELSWKDEQRFMYLRLRRLVVSNNEYIMEQIHHEREVLLQTPSIFTSRSPASSTYSGYGEFAGRFYYYGNMNEGAYESKFLPNDNSDIGSDDFDLEGFSDDSENGSTSTPPVVVEPPNMDLDIVFDLTCPIELAPIEYLERFKIPDFEVRYSRMTKSMTLSSVLKQDNVPSFSLQMFIYSPMSGENRLPAVFEWEIDSNNFDKSSFTTVKVNDYCSIPTAEIYDRYKIEILNSDVDANI